MIQAERFEEAHVCWVCMLLDVQSSELCILFAFAETLHLVRHVSHGERLNHAHSAKIEFVLRIRRSFPQTVTEIDRLSKRQVLRQVKTGHGPLLNAFGKIRMPAARSPSEHFSYLDAPFSLCAALVESLKAEFACLCVPDSYG
ncbi:hypothetical protein D3C78_884120 [compost metagenome]